jgi:hypothetical protein
MEAQPSELQQLREGGKVCCSVMLDAMDEPEGENMLPRTQLFAIHYPNLLMIPVEDADEWQAPGEHALHMEAAFKLHFHLADCLKPCAFVQVDLRADSATIASRQTVFFKCQSIRPLQKFLDHATPIIACNGIDVLPLCFLQTQRTGRSASYCNG